MSDEEFQTSSLDDVFNGETVEEPTVTEQPQEVVAEETTTEEASIEEVAPEVEEVAKPETIPVAALTEERAKRQDLERQLEEMRAKPVEPTPAPDVFEDQTAFNNHVQSQIDNGVMNVKLDLSQDMAVEKHGQEVVTAAFEALRAANDKAAFDGIMSKRNPYEALVQWDKQRQVVSEIGNDPQAWKDQERAKIKAEVEAEIVAKQAAEMAGKPAPSMAGVTGTGGGAPKTNWTGPVSLDSLFK